VDSCVLPLSDKWSLDRWSRVDLPINPKPTERNYTMKTTTENRVNLFTPNQIVATPGALEACTREHLLRCLGRHMRGGWGSVYAEDAALNNEAIKDGTRVLSAYPVGPAKPCEGTGSRAGD
jgi:hypothetical protein